MLKHLIPILALTWAGPAVVAQETPPRLDAGRVEVTLVLLDTVVTDRKGNPVSGLGIGDFDLLIDNVRVPIDAIEQRCEQAPASRALEASAAGRNFIILFDLSHMLLTSRNNAIRAAIQFVDDGMTAEDRVMVLAFMRGLHVISGFTTDRPGLRARLLRLLEDKSMVDPAPFEEENRLAQIVAEQRRASAQALRRGGFPSLAAANPACMSEAIEAEYRTARALRALANAMPSFGGLAGRKAFILFTETLRASAGSPFYDLCGAGTLQDKIAGLTAAPEIEDLQLRANLAGVSFYTVHAGGMGAYPANPLWQSARDLQVSLALATGGKNFILMKDPLAAFSQAARDLSCHYVLVWRPSDALKTGRHQVRVAVRGKGLQVRHREYFAVQTAQETSDSQLLAALSNPGLYRSLPVEAHGYSLAPSKGSTRNLLLKASVSLADLSLVPAGAGMRRGGVHLRGAVVAANALRCEFSEAISLERENGPDAALLPEGRAGVETLCDLEPGEHEVIIAARDETGGGMGAFWGRIKVKAAGEHDGMQALLWTPEAAGSWVRHGATPWLPSGPGPFFVRHTYRMPAREPAAVTFLACADGARKGNDAGPEPATLHLEGPALVDLPARQASEGQRGSCRLMRADIPSASLSAGRYLVLPVLQTGWRSPGSAVSLQVE
jgi:VWFA-related protein